MAAIVFSAFEVLSYDFEAKTYRTHLTDGNAEAEQRDMVARGHECKS